MFETNEYRMTSSTYLLQYSIVTSDPIVVCGFSAVQMIHLTFPLILNFVAKTVIPKVLKKSQSFRRFCAKKRSALSVQIFSTAELSVFFASAPDHNVSLSWRSWAGFLLTKQRHPLILQHPFNCIWHYAEHTYFIRMSVRSIWLLRTRPMWSIAIVFQFYFWTRMIKNIYNIEQNVTQFW